MGHWHAHLQCITDMPCMTLGESLTAFSYAQQAHGYICSTRQPVRVLTEANSPDASDCNFGGHWCLWSRFVSTETYLTTTNFSLFRIWPSASNAVIPPWCGDHFHRGMPQGTSKCPSHCARETSHQAPQRHSCFQHRNLEWHPNLLSVEVFIDKLLPLIDRLTILANGNSQCYLCSPLNVYQ